MRHTNRFGVLVPLALLVSAMAGAQTAPVRTIDAVAAATREFYSALNRADPDAADRYLLPGGDSFPRSGKPLDPEAATAEQSLRNLRRSFAAGLHFQVTIRDLGVRAYGDTAIATFYTEGATVAPDKSHSQGTYRATYVWVKKPGGWKIAHFHLSELVP